MDWRQSAHRSWLLRRASTACNLSHQKMHVYGVPHLHHLAVFQAIHSAGLLAAASLIEVLTLSAFAGGERRDVFLHPETVMPEAIARCCCACAANGHVAAE